jgi:hypothetical protein
VICDETNNEPHLIDNGGFVVDCKLKFDGFPEYINIRHEV